MRTIPKIALKKLLNINPTTSAMNLYIYMFLIADNDGYVRRDAFDLKEIKNITELSEISLIRAELFLRKKGLIEKNPIARYSYTPDEIVYYIEDYKDVSKGLIDISFFIADDFYRLSKAAKRLSLRLLIAEITKHSLRLSLDTVYEWSGVNKKSKKILLNVLDEVKVFFNWEFRSDIVYFYYCNDAPKHKKITTDFNEIYKMRIALKKYKIHIPENIIWNIYITRKRVGRSMFAKTLSFVSLQNLNAIRNIGAFINSIANRFYKQIAFTF